MATIVSVRLNDQEESLLTKASEVFNCKISSLMKKLVFERLEDEYDMSVITEYEKEKEAGTLELFDFDNVVKELEV